MTRHSAAYIPPRMPSGMGIGGLTPPPRSSRTCPIRWNRVAAWILAAAALVAGAAVWRSCRTRPPKVEPPPAEIVRYVEFGFPTDRTNLLDGAEGGDYMATASGRPESAMFGSTRTGVHGKQILPRFHEGIDIAPLHRDRNRAPLDDVVAAADGTVAYVNPRAGNSNYGIYVVLLHDDPAGPVYTMYAHLDAVDPSLRSGASVAIGTRLGRLGRTPAHIIPVERAHLHFEVGVILNPNFRRWFAAQKLKPDHGNYNGMNLLGIDPLIPYREQAENRPFSLRDHFFSTPPALKVRRLPVALSSSISPRSTTTIASCHSPPS